MKNRKSVQGKLFTIIVAINCILAFASCKKEKYNEPPVLSVTPVEMGHVTSVAVFGDFLDPKKKNCAFEYVLQNANDVVKAAGPGIVTKVKLNDNFNDYEISIKPDVNSTWTMIYDHVLNPSVAPGNNVAAGTLLGRVGIGKRTELQINSGEKQDESMAHCPFHFATQSFIDAHKTVEPNWCLENEVKP